MTTGERESAKELEVFEKDHVEKKEEEEEEEEEEREEEKDGDEKAAAPKGACMCVCTYV